MDDNDYDEIARRFFNEFLDLKVAIASGAAQKPRNFDKELAAYKKANDVLRKAAADLADDNKKLEEQLALADDRERELRRKLNEAVINLGRMKEKLSGLGGAVKKNEERHGYRFTDLMDEESKKLFETLMREIPRPGGTDGEA